MVATESAQIVLTNNDLRSIPFLLDSARQYRNDLNINAGVPILGTIVGGAVVALGGVGYLGVYSVWAATTGVSFINALRPRWRTKRLS